MSLVLGKSFKEVRPLGELISPNSGVWRHHPTDDMSAKDMLERALREQGIDDVELTFDAGGIPHITAKRDSSLYFAQGFVTAYYRLWQMDFLSRLTAGRASELLGKKALPVDRFFRRMKLPNAAEASAELIVNDPITKEAVLSYVRGVNARIEQIDMDSLPIEYRMFGTHPEPWTPSRIAYISKYMTWELTGYMYDYRFTNTKSKITAEILELLFPRNSQFPATVLGADQRTKPNRANTGLQPVSPRAASLSRQVEIPDSIQPNVNNGSNNWAIHGRNTASGKPIISNDLHLSYSLPALWFPVQLTTLKQNVFGASLPGTPGVIVGFNDEVSWAVTNGTNDVLDWHSLSFRDDSYREYFFNGTWRPIIVTQEKIYLPDGSYESIDTRETHFGPILFKNGEPENIAQTPAGLAIQWTGLIPSNELKTFLLLNHAKTSSECIGALKSYVAPPQNFLCADHEGKISYRLSGVFPERKLTDGRVVTDALTDETLWQGFLNAEDIPQKENVTDYIYSANQAPFNGERQSAFGWFFANPYRAETIRESIEELKRRGKIKPEDIVNMQASDLNKLTIAFIQWASQYQLEDSTLADPKVKACLSHAELEKWNRRHSPESKAASVAYAWMSEFELALWEPLIGNAPDHYWPSRWRMMQTISHAEDFSKVAMNKKPSELLSTALQKACAGLMQNHGKIPAWSDYQSTGLRHTGRIPGLGREKIRAGGSDDSIFANKGNHGPTWKLVVSMEQPPKAWMMIPGGKNGDPASSEYDGAVSKWGEGHMQPVHFAPASRKKKIE